MGNSAPSVLFLFKAKLSRETPHDFYVSGDQVEGIIEIVTNDKDNNLNRQYGPLYVELIGELHDFKTNTYQRLGKGVQVFFRKQVQVTKLSDDNQQLGTNRLRNYKWVFNGRLDSMLPSSLPPDDDCDPCICYYALVYLHHLNDLSHKFPFLVFTQTPLPAVIQQPLRNCTIEATVQHEDVKLHGSLPNNGLAVPGQTLTLEIEIDNPMKVTIKSIRVTLKQYRNIIHQETDFIIFSSMLPGFKPNGFNSEYRQSTYELPIPLEKCRIMAPTSSYKNVRYELHIQCHTHCLFNNHFTLTLPVICTTDHQQALKIMDDLKFLRIILQNVSTEKEENPPPSYEDFIVSEILPKYEDII